MRIEIASKSSYSKRRRFNSDILMEADAAKVKLAAAAEKLGREIHIFETSTTSPASERLSNNEESDEFYEFTAEDYYRILLTKKEEKFLKTRKIREAEEASRRARITKAVMRVRFPDNYTLEVNFHPSETFQSLVDLLKKVVTLPDLPFYLYTTPPKKQIKDLSQDFYTAGFVPGAIIYFSYDLPNGDDSNVNSVPFLQEEIRALNGLHILSEQVVETVESTPEATAMASPPPPDVQQAKASEKKPTKPKWFKM